MKEINWDWMVFMLDLLHNSILHAYILFFKDFMYVHLHIGMEIQNWNASQLEKAGFRPWCFIISGLRKIWLPDWESFPLEFETHGFHLKVDILNC